MKRLIFISSFDYPSRYAHAIHGLFMARAFQKALGESFLFFVNTVKGDSLAGIPHRLLFKRYGRCIKLLGLRRVLLPITLTLFFITRPLWRETDTIIFINDPQLIAVAVWLKRIYGVPFIFESHGSLAYAQEHTLAKHASRVIFLTSFLERDALTRHPSLKGRTSVIPNAVDAEAFSRVTDDRIQLRKELSLPQGFLVGYVGRFEPMGADKGLHLMIDALKDLPVSVRLLLVGGLTDEIARYETFAIKEGVRERVTFVAHVSLGLVPKYEKACDVLAYVPGERSAFYEKETSPMKLYEYMAAGRPMIVSDLPTTREAVPADAALFVPPGSKEAFVQAVEAILHAPAEADDRAKHATLLVAKNTWEHRIGRILEALV